MDILEVIWVHHTLKDEILKRVLLAYPNPTSSNFPGIEYEDFHQIVTFGKDFLKCEWMEELNALMEKNVILKSKDTQITLNEEWKDRVEYILESNNYVSYP